MNKVKWGYCIFLSGIISIATLTHDIPWFVKAIIQSFVICIPIAYYVLCISINGVMDIIMKDILVRLLEHTTDKSMRNILLCDTVEKYDHSWSGIWNVLKRYCEYADKNLQRPEREEIVKIINSIIDIDFEQIPLKESSFKKRIVRNMTFRYLLQKYVTYSLLKEKTLNLKTIYTFLYYIPAVFAFLLVICKNVLLAFLTPLSLVIFCLLYAMWYAPRFSIYLLTASWISQLVAFVPFPAFLSYCEFHSVPGVLTLIFYQLTLVITGLYLTNCIWTKTSFEKTKDDTPVKEREFISAIEARCAGKFRYIWLWITFFLIICCTVLMYAILYASQLHLGEGIQCFLASVSIYLGGGENELISTSIRDQWYISMELLSAFLINNLYLANIIRLILEPRLAEPNKSTILDG